MSDLVSSNAGPVDNSHSPNATLRALPNGSVKIAGGFWAARQATNHRVSLRHGYAMLEKAGNLRNLRMAAGLETGDYRGMNFSDETVYKWLEALAWELGRDPDTELRAMAETAITLISSAQQEDGYLNSYYQVVEPDKRWTDLDFGHELYCAGHLIQAGIAFQRRLGDGRLLAVARRLADHVDAVFGPGKQEATCGHPGIEMALVELFRLTGENRYLKLAQFFLDQRGKNRMRGTGANGPEYHQDHVPVREAREAVGHAVRQTYLAAAVADLYMETGEQALLDVSRRLWADVTGSKLYITGGIGSRYDGESFGESYELPPDQCYCETCSAIGSLFWNWRMLLASGQACYADLIERLLYNGILSSPGLDGAGFFYANPLMLRNGHYVRLSTNPSNQISDERADSGRPRWHSVACCPPNVMRLFASLANYLATNDQSGIQIHQYGEAEIHAAPGGRFAVALQVETDYPWNGRVRIRVVEGGTATWALSLRIPGWCQSYVVKVNDREHDGDTRAGYLAIERSWEAGDVVDFELAMPPFLVEADPRIDSVRGSLAIQRGPIIYCLEEHDQEPGTNLLDVEIDPATGLSESWRADLLGGLMVVEAAGCQRDRSAWPADALYRPLERMKTLRSPAERTKLTAIPYYAWGNRGLKSMRVWIPAACE